MKTFKRFGLTFQQDLNDKGQVTHQCMVTKYAKFHSYYEYDEQGKLIHSSDNAGYEYWKEYDEQGREVYCKTNNGRQYWREYNKNGDIHYKDTFGNEFWRSVRGIITKEQFCSCS